MPWHCKATGGYVSGNPVYKYPDADGLDNCDQIFYALYEAGWTRQAITGLLVCIGFESEYNPWRYEGAVQSTTTIDAYNFGYGLCQWTPASYTNTAHPGRNKYINNPTATPTPGYGPNYSDRAGSNYDGYAQMVWLDAHGDDQNDYYQSATWPAYSSIAPDFDDYKASTADPWGLCETWVLNYERPQNPTNNRTRRQALARELWTRYETLTPAVPDKPAGFPVWLLFKMRENNFKRW